MFLKAGNPLQFLHPALDVFQQGCPAHIFRGIGLLDPGRIHLEPLGYLHLCQGITIGNLFERPLKELLEEYTYEKHPIAGPLVKGGPAQLVNEYDLAHEPGYVDACHLCYTARAALRPRFPAELAPDQMYGVIGDQGLGPGDWGTTP